MNDLEIVYTLRRRINNLEVKLKILTCENVQNNVETNKKTVARINKIEARITKLKGILNYQIYEVYSNVSNRPASTSIKFDMKMKIIEIDIEDNITKLKMAPSSFKLVDKKQTLSNVIYPNDGTDRNLINLLARYRLISNKSSDFSIEPFKISQDSIETLIILIDNLTRQYGGELTFTNEELSYANSLQYIVCGIANLSNIHLVCSDFIQTAIFSVKLNINYDRDLARSILTMKNFSFDFIKSVSDVLHCKSDFIRIFSIEKLPDKRGIIKVNFGLTTPEKSQTEFLARHFQTLVRRSDFRNDKILRFIQSDRYRYELKTQLSYFQLSSKDFDQYSSNDYIKMNLSSKQKKKSENNLNTIPYGWFHYRINLYNKYFDNSLWCSNESIDGVWSIAYYGTSSIINNLSSIIKKDSNQYDSKNQMEQGKENTQSCIYLLTDSNLIADLCSKSIAISNGDNHETFKLIFQCRVRSNSFIILTDLINGQHLWKINDPNAIRPYALLIKQEN